MGKVACLLAGLLVGAIVGGGITNLVARESGPRYAYLSKELNYPVRTVVAEKRMREWAHYIHAGHLNESGIEKVIVYPASLEFELTSDCVVVTAELGLRPATADCTGIPRWRPATPDEARAWWSASPESRAKCYTFVCAALTSYLAQSLGDMDKNKIQVKFIAGRGWFSMDGTPAPYELGTYQAGKITMTRTAATQPSDK